MSLRVYRHVGEGTAGLQVLSARKLLPELPGLKERLDAGGMLLEVGCGTGRHLLQLTKAFPRARCVGVDIDPTGMKAAREAIEKAGVADRVDLVEGEVGAAVPEASVDAVVILGAVVLEMVGYTCPEQHYPVGRCQTNAN